MKPEKESFCRDVYNIVSQIPRGKVLTYGRIAVLAGWPRHSRLVGWTLRNVPSSLPLPCHRVVGSDGRTAPMWPEQVQLLRDEGVGFRPGGLRVDLSRHLWHPDGVD